MIERLDINEVVRRTVQLIRNQKLFEGIVITENLHENLPEINGDMNRLQQVILNLALNSCEAMPKGGTITITTSFENGEVQLEISDTGCGIKPEVMERIFEPFFTTKPVGQGTGLGLAVTYGIVQQHGGSIEVECDEGVGTKFIIALPVEKS
jgi:signal transduction histidine kinase